MSKSLISYTFFLLGALFITHIALSQTTKQQKMAQLSFMVGEWKGISKSFKDGRLTKEVEAFEKISYDLDSNILVIELNSPTLKLHTIVYYDEKDNSYYYYPFSKRGVNRAPARFEDGRLIVEPNAKRRYIFSSTPNGGFREHGEKLIDGKWVIYFQDDFQNTQ